MNNKIDIKVIKKWIKDTVETNLVINKIWKGGWNFLTIEFISNGRNDEGDGYWFFQNIYFSEIANHFYIAENKLTITGLVAEERAV